MKNIHLLLFICCFTFMAFQCDDEDNLPTSKESEQKALNNSKKAIEALAATSVCNETTTCKFIALGSKPCGGPWSYLVYSTSIDVKKLETMVETYNKSEAAFNQKWNIASDCAYAMPPTSVNCENNTCVAIY
ncbi:hypothetical protein [Mariniflexile maritimum]|uniref:hypothetical protein n=1 Tax=Mariniflexile maritimum TaxID=2682493 RepID=UPI0012F6BEB5|nr:hypothetical protein [Mariniflexile maritimum]